MASRTISFQPRSFPTPSCVEGGNPRTRIGCFRCKASSIHGFQSYEVVLHVTHSELESREESSLRDEVTVDPPSDESDCGFQRSLHIAETVMLDASRCDFGVGSTGFIVRPNSMLNLGRASGCEPTEGFSGIPIAPASCSCAVITFLPRPVATSS